MSESLWGKLYKNEWGHTLLQLGFVYKKTTAVPGKANPKAQQEFLDQYQQFEETKAHSDKIVFILYLYNKYYLFYGERNHLHLRNCPNHFLFFLPILIR